jgi:serpin B
MNLSRSHPGKIKDPHLVRQASRIRLRPRREWGSLCSLVKPLNFLLPCLLAVLTGVDVRADSVAANAINALGIELLHQTASAGANALLSPYSIQTALAMAYAGAAGQTRAEMARVLHYPADEGALNGSFAALQADLAALMQRQAAAAESAKQYGVTNDPLTLTTANRLFGQSGYDFRPVFLAVLKDQYQAPFEPLDFLHNASGATTHINDWVETQTHNRIRNLIPADALNRATRLVLVNAIYLKAPWETKFPARTTQPRPFHLAEGTPVDAPTMSLSHSLGYARRDGCSVVVLPYAGAELQLVILLPDDPKGLAAFEAGLTPELLAGVAATPHQQVILFLPKFKLEPPSLSLTKPLLALGLTRAFNQPPGSADFDRMAPRRPDDYLYISDIFHRTFLKLDEAGTEAAAATAVVMARAAAIMAPAAPPVEIHVDHPFLFALQHRASGACLFLGRVTDPRS